jgi:hypothetical protein
MDLALILEDKVSIRVEELLIICAVDAIVIEADDSLNSNRTLPLVTMTRSTSAVAPAGSGVGEAIAPGTRPFPETLPAMNSPIAKATAAHRLLLPVRSLVLIVSRWLGPYERARLKRETASQMQLNRDARLTSLSRKAKPGCENGLLSATQNMTDSVNALQITTPVTDHLAP